MRVPTDSQVEQDGIAESLGFEFFRKEIRRRSFDHIALDIVDEVPFALR